MKNRIYFLVVLMALMGKLSAQDSAENVLFSNSAKKMLELPSQLTIGGYGQVDFVQELDNNNFNNAKLDVHRLVMLFGYKFNSRTSFVTEIEFEHVKEVYIEQAFLDYRINRFMSLRTGLILIPMGFINEYHEPTSYNGTLRPAVDKYIVPTTWREIGAGITGNILPLSINYQLYILNGFNGYDVEANLGGNNGFRGGRQKAAKSFMSSPNFSARVQYYGHPSLNAGFSAYAGKSQSTLYNNLDKSNIPAVETADSSVVNSFWTGVDMQYLKSGMDLRLQFYHVNIGNAVQYNAFTGSDVGNSMLGYYVEAGYDVLYKANTEHKLKAFIRYEMLDTHRTTNNAINKNEAYNRNYLVTGIGWWMSPGAVLKADLQFSTNEASERWGSFLNLGMGIRF